MKKKFTDLAVSVLAYLIVLFVDGAIVYWIWQMIAPEFNLPIFAYGKIVAILIGLRTVYFAVSMKPSGNKE